MGKKFKQLFINRVFPNALKIARVAPVIKSENKNDIKTSRPIFLLPNSDLEKLILNRLFVFLVKYNVLNKLQHGFSQNLTTITALLMSKIIIANY